jgi:hypothetical protein
MSWGELNNTAEVSNRSSVFSDLILAGTPREEYFWLTVAQGNRSTEILTSCAVIPDSLVSVGASDYEHSGVRFSVNHLCAQINKHRMGSHRFWHTGDVEQEFVHRF